MAMERCREPGSGEPSASLQFADKLFAYNLHCYYLGSLRALSLFLPFFFLACCRCWWWCCCCSCSRASMWMWRLDMDNTTIKLQERRRGTWKHSNKKIHPNLPFGLPMHFVHLAVVVLLYHTKVTITSDLVRSPYAFLGDLWESRSLLHSRIITRLRPVLGDLRIPIANFV